MNTQLYHSFQQQLGRPQDDDSAEGYFDDARQGLLKDLVDFQNRDDFDSYMRSIEKTYYQKLNLPQPPYESLPDFPPKPFQQKKSKRGYYDEQKKDFIDKVNEVNQRRTQAYSDQALQQQRMMQQQQYYNNLQHPSINPYQNPYFDQMVVNKENAAASGYSTPMGYGSSAPPQYQVHTPSISGAHISHHGGIGGVAPMQQTPSNHYAQVMEPMNMMAQQMPPYLSKFVAGPTRLEANPLSEPVRNFKPLSPSKQQQPGGLPPLQMQDYDLKNPDVQFERYKHLMSNQYYNYHANSVNQGGFNMTSAHTVYNPPPPFTYIQGPPQPNQQQQDPYNMSFAAQDAHPQIQQPGLPQGHIFPQTQQIYPQLAGSVSLYQQPPPPMMPQASLQGGMPPPPQYIHPQVYRSIKQNNIVDKAIIDSIGGIENTLKPLEETLKQHELRPFQMQHDYRKEYYYSKKGKEMKRSLSECKPEQLKLVSVSPFRAVVKIDRHAQSQYNNEGEGQNQQTDEETDEDEQQEQNVAQQMGVNVTQYRQQSNDRGSPIRNDSQSMRGPREQFLNSFNEKRSFNNSSSFLNESYEKQRNAQGGIKEHQKIRMESEYLRQQREQFLQGFSSGGPPPLPTGQPTQQRTPQIHFNQR